MNSIELNSIDYSLNQIQLESFEKIKDNSNTIPTTKTHLIRKNLIKQKSDKKKFN